MAAAHNIKFGPVQGTVSSCTPNLMPFHIAHTGPAPIATFFRPKSAPRNPYGQESQSDALVTSDTRTPTALGEESQISSSSASTSTVVATSSTVSVSSETTAVAAVEDVDMAKESQDMLGSSSGERFVAAFRGRTIQGLEVDLPKGYTGVILQAPDPSKVQATQQSIETTSRRSKRTANTTEKIANRDDDGDNVDEAVEREDMSARHLTPTGTFSSFVVWHADYPVNEHNDDYIRSLTEWTNLSAEMHLIEDL